MKRAKPRPGKWDTRTGDRLYQLRAEFKAVREKRTALTLKIAYEADAAAAAELRKERGALDRRLVEIEQERLTHKGYKF